MSISGRAAADDGVTAIVLNGVVLPHSAQGFDHFTPFVITSGFVAGINTLDFVVENGAGPTCNPSGLRVEMTASSDTADLALAISDSPNPVSPGANLTYTLTVNNLGPKPATAVAVEQQLPSGPTFVSASSTLGSCSLVGSTVTCALGTMASGAAATITVVVRPTAPGALATTARVSAPLADPNPGNNNASANTTVQTTGMHGENLIEGAVSNPPATVARGGSFTVSDTAVNAGSLGAGTSFTRYYLSLDLARNAGDVLLTGSRSVPALVAGGSSTGPATLTVATNAKGGSFFLLACADDTKVVVEANEANNCVAAGSAVQVVGPDLSVTALSNPPATLLVSATMSVTDTTINAGTATAPASVTRYLLSLDTVRGAGDILLSGSRAIGALNAGVSSSGPASLSGYRLERRRAPTTCSRAPTTRRSSSKLDETNNCRPSSATVLLSGPDLRAASG